MLQDKTNTLLVSIFCYVYRMKLKISRKSNSMFSYLDVVGILQAVGPLTPFRNKYNVQENSIQFTISDMLLVF